MVLSTPHTTHAYGTSEQTAVRLSDTHVLFTISYRFNFLNRGFSTPLLASTATTRTIDRVNYAIMDNTGATTSVPVHAIVLADTAPVNGNMYTLPMSKGSDFTLIVIAELPVSEREHRLTVTSLPFTLIQDSGQQPSQMPETELAKFITPLVR